MMTFSLDALAQQLRDAEQSGQAIEPLRDILGVDNADAAYAIQRLTSSTTWPMAGGWWAARWA
jgi:2-keto-4-pentenoate hydratase